VLANLGALSRIHDGLARPRPGRVERESERQPRQEGERAGEVEQVLDDPAETERVRPIDDVPLEPILVRLTGAEHPEGDDERGYEPEQEHREAQARPAPLRPAAQ